MIRASICTIGDEILIGQITDTNSTQISKALGGIGIQTDRIVSIADRQKDILDTLNQELKNHDVVITTGGLGPTKDDITKEALARLTGSKGMYLHDGQYEVMSRILHSRGLDVLDINKAQAQVPDTAEVIVNHLGTAPVMVFRLSKELYSHQPVLYSMPGVPFETIAALDDVMDDIRRHHHIQDILHRNLMTYGMAESALAKLLEPWETSLAPDIHLAYLPNPLTGVKLRLSIYNADKEKDEPRLEEEIKRLEGILGDLQYSDRDDTLECAIGRILKAEGQTLSAAESCTGGEIAHLITTVAGSSAYFLGSVTSYAIPVKEKVLGVPAETIGQNGVVSSEVAAAMAEGVRKLTGSDWSVATTGFAGPGGGDERWPEGTVWVGVSSAHGTVTERFEYHLDRRHNIQRFSASALHLLLMQIRKSLAR